MTDLLTINPDQLAIATTIPADAMAFIWTPAGPLQKVPHGLLLSKLIATNLCKVSKAALEADLDHPADSVALVFNDATVLQNGWYRKTGISGAGTWLQFETLALQASQFISNSAMKTEAAIALGHYFDTRANGVAGTALSEAFSSDETGTLRLYRHTAVAPYYVEIPWPFGDTVSKVLTPEQFGAVGDGVADDTAAFIALSAEMTTLGCGAVRLRLGADYILGKQTKAAGGYAYRGEDILFANGLDWFVLDMNGATIKRKAGMRFGGFDAADVPTVAQPNYNNAQAAHTGVLVRAEACGAVVIRNGKIDGNSAGGIVGGPWGDTGRQCVDYGLFIAECDHTWVENLVANDHLLDGIAYRYNGLTTASAVRPASFHNCKSIRSGRNTFSQVGGNGLRVVGCVFDVPGYAPNAGAAGGYVHSAPASGFDVEAEGTVISNPVFEHCTFAQGVYGNTAFVTDSGTSSGHQFRSCRFDGLAWLNKPGIVLEDCQIDGKFSVLFGGDAATATRLIRCTGGDTPKLAAPNPSGLFIDMGGSGNFVRLEDCRFTLARTGMNLRGVQGRDCRFVLSATPAQVANQQAVVLLDTAEVDAENFVFIDQLAGYPANEGLFIATTNGVQPGQRLRNCRVVPGASFWLKWNSWSNGGGGYPRAGKTNGRFDAGTEAFQAIAIQREGNFGGGENGLALIEAFSAAPSAASREVGSVTFNTGGAPGGIAAWYRASDATFKPFGIIGAVRAATSGTTYAAPAGGATVDAEARASLAQLAADLADMKTKLQAAVLMA